MRRLESYLLNTLYAVVAILCTPLLLWAAATKGKYREGWMAKLLGQVPQCDASRPRAWIHAVSVGEVNLLATTIGELANRRPDLEVVISTTTKTGFDLANRKYGADHTVFYCPLDFSWAVRRAMRRVNPTLLVLAELELWPNLIAAAQQHGAQVAIINGRLSDNSYRGYSRIGWLVGRVLRQVDLIAAQDGTTADRFRQLRNRAKAEHQSDAVVVTGSLKYDGASTDRTNSRTTALRELFGLTDQDIVWLVGSTQAPEEQLATEIFSRLHDRYPELKLVVVPRHPERFDEVAAVLDASGLDWQRRSERSEPSAHRSPSPALLVDTVGELGAWWGTADIGFVGGSFGDRGGQNMIEPAAYGVATCFGPNTWNFRDIVAALLAADAAQVVADRAELERFVERCLTDRQFAHDLGARAQAFVTTQLGATSRTVDLLERLLPTAADQTQAAA
ncbi:3-deoxy-D-manno-octulosonic acid transferase [Aeoliella sp. ICT_H6.2]|uniref:3-deoxy-D-manno-octulosonic acid transferase n=1 Tax=Aeoliella straminimaris TaxID=2954799 RepID=A0A9X2FG32_9BACT|nr:3-deoxy-D-manno-octulosonic acid transferase [Aeoliella straminimaris]MCO6047648.1 3-deoxy-D-manno-octulosonic acid transferase [Aeoliella straminimaris]